MKKVLSLSIMALALIAFASTSSFACGEEKTACSSKEKTTTAQKASATTDASKTCSAASTSTSMKASATSVASKTCSTENATKASASATCSASDLEACAKKMGMSVEEIKKMCGENGTMAMHTISIKGMTCGSCESSVTTAIEAVKGVNKVVSISYKDANAVVCVDKSNTCLTTLTKTIVDKGYKAEIIPAVATTASAPASDSKACAKTCSTAEKAACASKETAKKVEDTK